MGVNWSSLREAARSADPNARAGAVIRGQAALEQFMRKCLYLAAKRIQDLCLRLLLPEKLTQLVWDVVKLILDKARHLLEGRHLDQLMCPHQRSVVVDPGFGDHHAALLV